MQKFPAEYRFNGNSLSQLPRGALIEMGSPDAAALETPKRRRLHDLTNATPSGSQAQQQWHYRATQANAKNDVYRPLNLTDADKVICVILCTNANKSFAGKYNAVNEFKTRNNSNDALPIGAVSSEYSAL